MVRSFASVPGRLPRRATVLLDIAGTVCIAALAASACGCSESSSTPASVPLTTAPEPAPASASATSRDASNTAQQAGNGPTRPTAAVDTAPGSTTAEGTARIYSKARFAWIYPAPKRSKGWLGYLSIGSSVPLKGGSAEKARVMGGAGCDAWYAVEPVGFVCAGASSTLDPNDPVVVGLSRDAPDVDSPWPYSYGESIGAPRYPTIPTPVEQRAAEWDLEQHLEKVARAKGAKSREEVAAVDKVLVGVDLSPSGQGTPALLDFGPLVREERKWVAIGSTVAFTRAFDVEQRTFLLASDKAVVPKDRVKPYPRSEFRGVELGRDVSLPIAWFRKKPRPKYKRGDDGSFFDTGATWPARAWVALTGEEVTQGTQRFLATREPGVFASADDATVVRAVTEAPFLRKEDDRGGGAGRRTWLDISVLGGWLVAYEGLTPVFTTLISPGRGGVPIPGVNPLTTASTPIGRFRIDGKFRTATMVSSTDANVVHAEVQFTQNFSGPHALHGAYWHDVWGEPKSGGCVNLSPIDAKYLFEWTEPKVPEGWYGLRSTKDFGTATEVSLHR